MCRGARCWVQCCGYPCGLERHTCRAAGSVTPCVTSGVPGGAPRGTASNVCRWTASVLAAHTDHAMCLTHPVECMSMQTCAKAEVHREPPTMDYFLLSCLSPSTMVVPTMVVPCPLEGGDGSENCVTPPLLAAPCDRESCRLGNPAWVHGWSVGQPSMGTAQHMWRALVGGRCMGPWGASPPLYSLWLAWWFVLAWVGSSWCQLMLHVCTHSDRAGCRKYIVPCRSGCQEVWKQNMPDALRVPSSH